MNKTYHIYTDGACRGNPGPGGYGVVVLNKEEDTIIYTHKECEKDTTNNRQELSAIIYALNLAISMPNVSFVIHSDSAYCVNICNDWMWKWANNNWCNSKKQIIENYDLVREIYYLYNLPIFARNFEVKKVSGHSGLVGNELADALATGDMRKFERIVLEYSLKEE